MEKKDKRPETTSIEDAWRKAIQSWLESEPNMDFDELETPHTGEMVEKLHESLKREKN